MPEERQKSGSVSAGEADELQCKCIHSVFHAKENEVEYVVKHAVKYLRRGRKAAVYPCGLSCRGK